MGPRLLAEKCVWGELMGVWSPQGSLMVSQLVFSVSCLSRGLGGLEMVAAWSPGRSYLGLSCNPIKNTGALKPPESPRMEGQAVQLLGVQVG